MRWPKMKQMAIMKSHFYAKNKTTFEIKAFFFLFKGKIKFLNRTISVNESKSLHNGVVQDGKLKIIQGFMQQKKGMLKKKNSKKLK